MGYQKQSVHKVPVAESVSICSIMFQGLLSICIALNLYAQEALAAWPPLPQGRCLQGNKLKAMYARMGYSPGLATKPFNKMEVTVEWNDLQVNPGAPPQQSGIYVAYNTGNAEKHSGYLGIQIKPHSGQFLFSFWDYQRFTGKKHTPSYRPQKAALLAWPASNERHCRRHCLDCAQNAQQKNYRDQGLTTGTQCLLVYPQMKVGDKYRIVFERVEKQATLDTASYGGGMNSFHANTLNEADKTLTGAKWDVYAYDLQRQSNVKISIGSVLLEGSGVGMDRLTTFDEMLGCTKCGQIQHTDTRYGPIVVGEDGVERNPIKMSGLTKKAETSCNNLYWITGNQQAGSVQFQSGPLTSNDFPYAGPKYQDIWP